MVCQLFAKRHWPMPNFTKFGKRFRVPDFLKMLRRLRPTFVTAPLQNKNNIKENASGAGQKLTSCRSRGRDLQSTQKWHHWIQRKKLSEWGARQGPSGCLDCIVSLITDWIMAHANKNGDNRFNFRTVLQISNSNQSQRLIWIHKTNEMVDIITNNYAIVKFYDLNTEHARNVLQASVIFSCQNLFVANPEFRSMSLNSHYIFLTKNARDTR